MALAKTSLEQWAVLAAVVDEGGYAQAAAALHRSQSAVSYAVSRLQEELDVPLLVIEGRKAVLTPHGQTLLQRARGLLRDMNTLELLARSLKQGWEAELRLVVDAAFPRAHLMKIVAELQQLCPNTQMQLSDAVLSGAEEAIADGSADVAVARPDHALFGVGHDLSFEDLTRYVQVVVRDSGVKHPRDEGWLGAERRCTVSSMEASLAMVKAGLGYAWLPEHMTSEAIQQGTLRALPLEMGSSRPVSLHLVLVRPNAAGPAARAAVEIFQRHRPYNRSLS